jgi:hypothetical protein
MSSTLKMEAEGSPETSVNICHTTERYIIDDSNLYGHCYENIKFKIISFPHNTESSIKLRVNSRVHIFTALEFTCHVARM